MAGKPQVQGACQAALQHRKASAAGGVSTSPACTLFARSAALGCQLHLVSLTLLLPGAGPQLRSRVGQHHRNICPAGKVWRHKLIYGGPFRAHSAGAAWHQACSQVHASRAALQLPLASCTPYVHPCHAYHSGCGPLAAQQQLGRRPAVGVLPEVAELSSVLTGTREGSSRRAAATAGSVGI